MVGMIESLVVQVKQVMRFEKAAGVKSVLFIESGNNGSKAGLAVYCIWQVVTVLHKLSRLSSPSLSS